MSGPIAAIICTEYSQRMLLGLTLGERVLLALKYSGVERVVFLGQGPQPQCERAALSILDFGRTE